MNDVALALVVLAASAAALCGLLALWAAAGRGHWFLRAAVVAAAIGALLPVPAFDLAIVFLSQSLAIVMPCCLLRLLRSASRSRAEAEWESDGLHRGGYRFSLVDLFLLTLVAAGIASLGAYLPAKHRGFWVSYLLFGASAGAVCLAAAWAALGSRWPWLRWSVLVAVALGLGLGAGLADVPEEISDNLPSPVLSLGSLTPGQWFPPVVMCSLGLVVASWLSLLNGAGWVGYFSPDRATHFVGGQSERPPWTRWPARIAAALIPLFMSLPVGVVYFRMLFPTPIPPLKAPEPNGYEVLVKLGEQLEQTTLLEADDPSEEDLQTFVSANRERLRAAHSALDLPHVANVNYEQMELDDCVPLRGLARAFAAEARLAALARRPDDSAAHGLDIIRLGRITAHGRILVDWLVGSAIESVGLERLSKVRTSISLGKCRQLIAELQRFDANRERIDDALAREDIWQQHVCGWPARVFPGPESFVGGMGMNIERARSATTRLLICDLAIRLYREEKGERPERLEQLVPRYLDKLPDDPFSQRPLLYRPRRVIDQLYSVGPDLKDDGGEPTPGGVIGGNGDWTLGP